MGSEARILTYTRRDLLRVAGAFAATVAASNLLAGSQAPSYGSAPAPLHLGVILPRSTPYPQLRASIVAGLELFFAQTVGRPIALRSAEIAPGSGYIGSVVDRLLVDGPLDFLIGMVTPTVAAQLDARLVATDTVFINATVGANIPRLDDASPLILHSSLAHWQGSWALGNWAATALGKRGLLLASLYDSGYDAFYTFRLGFEEQGGTVLTTQVTAQPVRASELAALLASPAAQGAEFLYAAYSGQAAIDFLRAYAALPASLRLPLVGSPFLADTSTLRDFGGSGVTVHTAAAWAAELDTPGNAQFAADYRAQTGQEPDILAVLGYDTARLIDRVASSSSHGRLAASGLAVGLAASTAFGPRESLSLDPATQIVASPLYLRTVTAVRGGLVSTIDGRLMSPSSAMPQLAALRASVKTGWLTPYLCG